MWQDIESVFFVNGDSAVAEAPNMSASDMLGFSNVKQELPGQESVSMQQYSYPEYNNAPLPYEWTSTECPPSWPYTLKE